MGRSRYRICDPVYPYFLTCTVVRWLPVFANPDAAAVLLESLRFLQSERGLVLYAFVIMENHLHMVARSERLAELLAQFKSYTARRIIDDLNAAGRAGLLHRLAEAKSAHKLDRNYQLWQEGSHPECVQSETILRQKVEYIHLNPVRRGYVELPEHWRYSSARNYAGLPGLLEVERVW